LEITYKFDVLEGASFDQDYRVFAHVKDSDGERIWDDDHNPPVPTTMWKPGQTIHYTRTVFVPIFPYVGAAALEIGLHSTTEEKRLPLKAEPVGQFAYRVARFELLPQTENLYTVFKEGWNMAESSQQNSLVEWQWTKKEAVLAFRNLKKELMFYLDVDSPGSPFEMQEVQVLLGGHKVDEFVITSTNRVMRKIQLPAGHMGSDEMSEIHIVVDKTFVPAQTNPGSSLDTRVLGIRVFHAYMSQ
jgi:hypothetical protein